MGIAQDGIAFSAGEQLDVSIWLRGKSRTGVATAQLLDRDGIVAECTFPITGAWKKHVARLVPVRGSVHGSISFTFKGPGEVWLDNASLMPLDTVAGWRKDVFEAVQALRPGLIRYGGCAVDNTADPKHFAFDWQDTLGDVDRRKPFWAWGGIQHTGPGLEEIVRFIQAVGAEVMLAVRVSKRTARDAADMVEYFNGSVETPMGGKRATNGHPESYRVKYWQVGNELSGEAYEAALPEFCAAMRAVDPTIILLSSFPSDRTIEVGDGYIDYICPHHYNMGDLKGVEADLDLNAKRCASSKRRLRVGVTEWNVTAMDPGLQRAKIWTLAGALACARYRNLLHRRCDLVEISNRSNIANSICTGAIQTDRSRLFLTPAYHVERLYATLAGNRVLVVNAPDGSPVDINATYQGGPESCVTIFIVNASLQAAPCSLDLSGLPILGTEARMWTLTDRSGAGEPDAANSFREPNRIAPVTSAAAIEGKRLRIGIPALSLVVLRVQVESFSAA